MWLIAHLGVNSLRLAPKNPAPREEGAGRVVRLVTD